MYLYKLFTNVCEKCEINQEITFLIVGPEELRRKRQRTDGDSILHASLQQQQKKIQSDHPGSRMPTWNAANIPAIKTEPREASPQPFAIHRGPSEMTPSPQPLSPSSNYNLPNTPSPYNMTMGGNTPLMSPNHQYRVGTPNVDAVPTPLDVQNDYAAYGGGQQQQQQQHTRLYVRQHQIAAQHVAHQQHQQQMVQYQQQQQQYHGALYNNNNNNNNDIGNWEEKFANVLANANHTNAVPTTAMNNLNNNNNNNNNQLNMHNMLAANASNMAGVTQHPQWNFPPNVMQDPQLLQQQSQQQQQQQQPQHLQQHHQQPSQRNFPQHPQQQGQPNDTGMVDLTRNEVESVANNEDLPGGGEQGPTISNLLNFDSGQLVHINSEEQQMLRLTSDELRLSNLSISS